MTMRTINTTTSHEAGGRMPNTTLEIKTGPLLTLMYWWGWESLKSFELV